MIALSDIIILTVSSALLVVALMRAYSPDDTISTANTTSQVRQQPAPADSPANNPASSSQVQNGDTAPAAGTTSTAAQSTGTLPVDNNQVAAQQSANSTTSTQAPAPEVVLESYTVQSGDSLSLIASRTGTTVRQLQELNQLSGTVIQIGQILRYPSP